MRLRTSRRAHVQVRALRRLAARHSARNARLLARPSRRTREGLGPCAFGGVLGGLGRRRRYNVYGGEQRRTVEVECDLDAAGLGAVRNAARLMLNMVERVALEVSLRRMRAGPPGWWGRHKRRKLETRTSNDMWTYTTLVKRFSGTR